VQPVVDSELGRQLDQVAVAPADEVIETLDWGTVEHDRAGEPTRLLRRLQDKDVQTAPPKPVGRRQPRETSAQNADAGR
jgi:hypothetical protein